jgi:HSP20 family protein
MKLAHKTNDNWFPSFMDEMLNHDFTTEKSQVDKPFAPAINVRELEDKFLLEMIIPGFKKDEVTIEVDKDLLTVSSKVEAEADLKKQHFSRKEFTKRSFKRTFNIPETVNQDGIEAGYENGILTISLLKKEEALPQPKRVISLK